MRDRLAERAIAHDVAGDLADELVSVTSGVGAALAAAIMLGAIASHVVGPVGLEVDAGAMFPLVIVMFIAAVASAFLGWKRGMNPFVKHAEA